MNIKDIKLFERPDQGSFEGWLRKTEHLLEIGLKNEIHGSHFQKQTFHLVDLSLNQI